MQILFPECPACEYPMLDLVQPDEWRPDIVVAICPDCGAMFDAAPESPAAPGGAGEEVLRWRVAGRISHAPAA